MKTSPKHKKFKPVLAILLAVLLYLVFVITLNIFANLAHVDVWGTVTGDNYLGDMADPIQVFFQSLVVAVMIPSAAIAVRLTGLGGFGSLSSVD